MIVYDYVHQNERRFAKGIHTTQKKLYATKINSRLVYITCTRLITTSK